MTNRYSRYGERTLRCAFGQKSFERIREKKKTLLNKNFERRETSSERGVALDDEYKADFIKK
ncbi:unnamed protein product [Clavelina lepadiformis]|uniref:Uncharacterized protein n=1 Tax=Clavelina lepadiformis TaxID=159417 RepID=A0ABP0F7Y4_CLALP